MKSHKPPSHGRSYRGTYHYWHPIRLRPVHLIRYRAWHALWWFLERHTHPLSLCDDWRCRITRAALGATVARRNAAYTGYTLLEHCDDWREGRW